MGTDPPLSLKPCDRHLGESEDPKSLPPKMECGLWGRVTMATVPMRRLRNLLAVSLLVPCAAFGATAVFQQPLRLALPPGGPAGGEWTGTADFDNDGRSDLLIQSDAMLSVHRGNGDMTFATAVQTPLAMEA